jgi:hypothetical protein
MTDVRYYSEGPPYYSGGQLVSVDDWQERQHRLMGRMTMLTVRGGSHPAVRRHIFPLVVLGFPVLLAAVLLLVLKIKGYL